MTAWAFNCDNDEMKDFVLEGGKAYVEPDVHSVFPSILIGLAILPARGLYPAEEILGEIGKFLVDNRYRFGLWQHFTKGHPWYHVNPCDMDDTALASRLLMNLGLQTPRNRGTMLSNRRSDGRFYTWFALRGDFSTNPVFLYHTLRELRNRSDAKDFWSKTECEPDDVDAVVNANVLSYLGLDEGNVSVVEWINKILSDREEDNCDKWYRNLSSVYYFFSSLYRPNDTRLEKMRQMIRERVLARISPLGCVERHPMDTAMAVSTLLNLDCANDISPISIGFLIENQRPNGAWPRKVVYYGGPRKIVGWGGDELTTSFCIEAVFRYFLSENGKKINRDPI